MILMREGGRYDSSRGAVGSYLRGIARHLVLPPRAPRVALRRARRGSCSWRAGDPGANPDSRGAADPKDEVRRVHEALLRVTPRLREVLVLCDLQGRELRRRRGDAEGADRHRALAPVPRPRGARGPLEGGCRAGARVEAGARAVDAMSCSDFREAGRTAVPRATRLRARRVPGGWPASAGRPPRSRTSRPASTAPSCRRIARPSCAQRSGRRGGRPRRRTVGAGPGPWRLRRHASWSSSFSSCARRAAVGAPGPGRGAAEPPGCAPRAGRPRAVAPRRARRESRERAAPPVPKPAQSRRALDPPSRAEARAAAAPDAALPAAGAIGLLRRSRRPPAPAAESAHSGDRGRQAGGTPSGAPGRATGFRPLVPALEAASLESGQIVRVQLRPDVLDAAGLPPRAGPRSRSRPRCSSARTVSRAAFASRAAAMSGSPAAAGGEIMRVRCSAIALVVAGSAASAAAAAGGPASRAAPEAVRADAEVRVPSSGDRARPPYSATTETEMVQTLADGNRISGAGRASSHATARGGSGASSRSPRSARCSRRRTRLGSR